MKDENQLRKQKFVDVLKRILTHNFWLKITSLLLAFALWYGITGGPRSETSLTVNLDLGQYIPEGWALAETYRSEIQLRLRGSDNMIQSITDNSQSGISILLDKDSIKPTRDTQEIEIKNSNITLRAGLELLSIFPNKILVQLDEMLEESKQVKVEIIGQIPEGYVLNGKPIVEPAFVDIRGAARLVKQLEELQVQVNYSSFPVSNSRQSNIIPLDRNPLLDYAVADVQVILDIIEISATKEINVDRFEFEGTDVETESIRPSPAQFTWEITGPKSWIEELTADSISLLIDLEGQEINPVVQISVDPFMIRFDNPPSRLELVTIHLVSRSSDLTLRFSSE